MFLVCEICMWPGNMYCMLLELAVRSQQGGTGVGHNVVALLADLGKEQANSVV